MGWGEIARTIGIAAGIASGCGDDPAGVRAPPLGQWVWTEADAARIAEIREARPETVAGVHVATVSWRGGRFENGLGLSPQIAGSGPVAAVIRIDDSAHAAWRDREDSEISADLDAAIGRVVAMIHARDLDVKEIQLDYDVPTRLLPRWAAVLGHLRASSLAGERVWVTSLVAHLRDPAYGDLLRGRADGHIVQVFDTGDDPGSAQEVASLAERAAIPYRLGLGAFERGGDRPTAHRAWFARIAVACPPPRCEAVWVFPAGRPYQDLLGDPP